MRILAVTADASLLTALTSMLLDWEIASVRDPADAKPVSEGAAVALVESGATERGIATAKALWEHGVTLPCLIIGDAQPPPGTRVRVLVRPFNLHDLTSAVEEVSREVPIDPRAAGEEPEPEPEAVTEEPEPPALVEQEAEEEPPHDLSAALGAAEPETAPAIEEPVAVALPEEPRRREPARRVKAPEPAPVAGFDREAALPLRPMPATPLPTRQAERPGRDAGARRRFLRRRDLPGAKEASQRVEDPMIGRLRHAIATARELEALVHELPVLAQPRAMAHAFLGEVVEMFAPQIAAVFAPSPDGDWAVIAAHGLSAVEAGLKVPPDQELFLEIAQSLEAVLVAPVDLAQGLVAGIGGARTEALIAAPLSVGGMCHAIVVVGRPEFTEFDLDLLAEQAAEAAPGLAVAQMIDRLRGL